MRCMTQWSYVEIQRILESSRGMGGPAEAHGTLAGALCAASGYTFEDWLGEILPDARSGAGASAALRMLYTDTAGAMTGEAMTVELLLPDDDRPLAERADALGAWCQGFLYGLGSSRIPDIESLPGDAGEVVRDLAQIARVCADPEESDESGESAYAELVEFVRVGARLLFEDLAPYRDLPPAPSEPLH